MADYADPQKLKRIRGTQVVQPSNPGENFLAGYQTGINLQKGMMEVADLVETQRQQQEWKTKIQPQMQSEMSVMYGSAQQAHAKLQAAISEQRMNPEAWKDREAEMMALVKNAQNEATMAAGRGTDYLMVLRNKYGGNRFATAQIDQMMSQSMDNQKVAADREATAMQGYVADQRVVAAETAGEYDLEGRRITGASNERVQASKAKVSGERIGADIVLEILRGLRENGEGGSGSGSGGGTKSQKLRADILQKAREDVAAEWDDMPEDEKQKVLKGASTPEEIRAAQDVWVRNRFSATANARLADAKLEPADLKGADVPDTKDNQGEGQPPMVDVNTLYNEIKQLQDNLTELDRRRQSGKFSDKAYEDAKTDIQAEIAKRQESIQAQGAEKTGIEQQLARQGLKRGITEALVPGDVPEGEGDARARKRLEARLRVLNGETPEKEEPDVEDKDQNDLFALQNQLDALDTLAGSKNVTGAQSKHITEVMKTIQSTIDKLLSSHEGQTRLGRGGPTLANPKQVEQARLDLLDELGREPTKKEIADHMTDMFTPGRKNP